MAIKSEQPNSNFNFRLILQTTQDPHHKTFAKTLGQVTKYVFLGILTLQFALPSSYMGNSKVADASIKSAVSSILGVEASASETEISTNSQKMPLLEAPINPTMSAQASNGPLVDTTALIAPTQVSPSLDASSTKTDSAQKQTKITTYVVKSGDTISGIAENFDITASTILTANNLKRSDSISVGQKLIILPVSGVKYVVVPGDTVSSIADKYKGDTQEIISYNEIVGEKLTVGETIVIPDGEMPATVLKVATKAPAKSTSKTSTLQKVASVALGVNVAKASDDAPVTSSSGLTRPITGGVKTQGIHDNNGVDLADSCGTPIYAAASGSVIVSKDNNAYNGGFGNYVVIDHPSGIQTLYAHMQTVLVNEGDSVTQGQQIGTIGATGKVQGVTGCHVHFEVHGGKNPF